MGCNCGGDIKADVRRWVAEESRKAEIVAAQAEIDARRVMCMLCTHRRGKAWISDERRATSDEKRHSLGVCVGGGEPVMIGLTIAGVRPCPRGRHPDHAGRVRSEGMQWLGVPIYYRPLARLLGRGRGGVGAMAELPGCGCIRALKTRWRWWKRRRGPLQTPSKLQK